MRQAHGRNQTLQELNIDFDSYISAREVIIGIMEYVLYVTLRYYCLCNLKNIPISIYLC